MSFIETFKKHFFLTVQTFDEALELEVIDSDTLSFMKEVYGDDALVVTAWRGEFMVDYHITAIYPDLEDIGMSEECEGFMVCIGFKDKSLLESELIERNFSLLREDIVELSEEEYIDKLDSIEGELDDLHYIEDLDITEELETDLEKYTRLLNKAIEEEEFLKAAEYRDKIKDLTSDD